LGLAPRTRRGGRGFDERQARSRPHRARLHVSVGAYTTAIEVIQVDLRTAHETFPYAKHAPILVVKWVQALTALGRWPEALGFDEALGEAELPQLSHAALLISLGEIHLARGDRSAAKSNRQIAAELFISGNTAGVHVSRILTKLGAATRTEAARGLFDELMVRG
jgi:hypothetical protein